MVLLSAAGCGRQGDRGSTGGTVTVDFWNGFTGPDGETMELLVRRFNREHPHIRVKMQIIPWATYYDKITLGLAYGGSPDVFILHVNRFPEYAFHNAVEPLEDLIRQDGLDLEDFEETPLQAARWNGRQHGIPLDCHPIGLYYNRELFRKAGIVDASGEPAPPQTLEQFLDAAKKLTIDADGDGKPEQWGFAWTWLHTNAYTMMNQFGTGILTEDLSRSDLTSPEAEAAMRLMQDFIYKHRICPSPEGQDSWMGFQTGKVAMALEGVYMLSSLQEQTNLDFAAAPTPRFGPKMAAWAGSHLLVMPRGIRQREREAAWVFIRYLSDNSLEWAKGGQVPVRKSILRSPGFQQLEVQRQFSLELPYVQFEPASVDYNQVAPFGDAAIEAVLTRIKEPEVALKEAAERIDKVLER